VVVLMRVGVLDLSLVGACMRCSLRGWLCCAMVLSGGLRLVVFVCHARGVVTVLWEL